MSTSAPSAGRIAVAVGFALSCFALLLFLWISFGGPVPLKPEGYRFHAKFAEADKLAQESDVRISGVNVGKVKSIAVDPDDNLTVAEIEVDEEFAPISKDARAMLRMKTLVGETFVEMTLGSKDAEKIPEGGFLEDTQVRKSVKIDDIFNALDEPTRENFRQWQFDAAEIIKGPGQLERALAGEPYDPRADRATDLSDVLGNLGPFAEDASDVLETLNRQDRALQQLFRDTGEVFAALAEDQNALQQLVVNSHATFGAIASRNDRLAEMFQVFPTFLEESRLTFRRTQRFARDTNPLINELRPVARELVPTLQATRRFAPNLERLLRNLDPLIRASRRGLPAQRRFLDELRPVLPALDPMLANLNPAFRYLEANKATFADFFNPAAGISGVVTPDPDQPAPKRALRSMTYTSSETLALHPERLSTNRGFNYRQDGTIGSILPHYASVPSFDCENTDDDDLEEGQQRNPETGEVTPGKPGYAACILSEVMSEDFGGLAAPQVTMDD